MIDFSNKNRSQKLYEISQSVFDLIVIGGGITGAGIALDAASRGLKILVVEKADFASGTSSKSTRLIHGGLRYLKNFHFKQVRDTAQERKIIHSNVSHLVYPENLIIPTFHNKATSKPLLYLGLTIYELLGSVKRSERKRILSRKAIQEMLIGISPNKLSGGIVYKEYRTNDARLVIETFKEASRLGAVAINYLECDNIDSSTEGFTISCTDRVTGKSYSFSSHALVNASGPWVDKLRKLETPDAMEKLVLSKGIHLVFTQSDLPISSAVYFEANDGRFLFIIPNGDYVYVGTTDTFYDGPIDNIDVTLEEINYVIDCVVQVFPGINLTIEKLHSFWAGVRPLIKEEGKKPGEISRKDEIFISPSGMVTIAGGKLTGFRKMARKVVDLILKNQLVPKEFTPSLTDEIQYASSIVEPGFMGNLSRDFPLVSQTQIGTLYSKYGAYTRSILNSCKEWNEDEILFQEIRYTIKNEMVLAPSDFLFRRTNSVHFNNHPNLKALYEEIASIIADEVEVGTIVDLDRKIFLSFIDKVESVKR